MTTATAHTPVVNKAGNIIGRVSASTTSIGAARMLGAASAVFSRHPVHGYSWQPK